MAFIKKLPGGSYLAIMNSLNGKPKTPNVVRQIATSPKVIVPIAPQKPVERLIPQAKQQNPKPLNANPVAALKRKFALELSENAPRSKSASTDTIHLANVSGRFR